MKLYVADYAPNPRRVRWVLNEKGVRDGEGGVTSVDVDIMALEHKTHPILLKSGASALPVLELDDGTVLAELVAIGRYLESLYPEPNLFGRDALEIAQIEMWTRRIEQNLATPLMHATRLKSPALAVLEEPNEAAADYLLAAAAASCERLDAHLAGRDFIAAERFTIADIITYCALDFARLIRFRPDKSLTELGRWRDAVHARPTKPEMKRGQ